MKKLPSLLCQMQTAFPAVAIDSWKKKKKTSLFHLDWIFFPFTTVISCHPFSSEMLYPSILYRDHKDQGDPVKCHFEEAPFIGQHQFPFDIKDQIR